MQSCHGFSFDISLRHPSEAPEVITKALSLKPNYAWASESKIGAHLRNGTAWNGTIVLSSGAVNADDAFRLVTDFFKRNGQYCKGFIDTSGEIDLVLKGRIDESAAALHEGQDQFKSKVFELTLYPEFLKIISTCQVAFVIQMWAN